MTDVIIIIIAICVIASLSFYAAYRVVIHNKTICAQEREQNGDVYLDDICEKYLRLTK